MIFPCLTNVPVKNVPSPKSREGGHRRMREKGGGEKKESLSSLVAKGGRREIFSPSILRKRQRLTLFCRRRR